MTSIYRFGQVVLPKPFKRVIRKATQAWYKAQPEPLRSALKNVWEEIRVARASRQAIPRFLELKNHAPLKVHLGCGEDIKIGWLNIDHPSNELANRKFANQPNTWFIAYDLRLELPLDEESCELIYSSHFFEHLDYSQGLRLMRDCYRALTPGGIFRISLPNGKGILDAYIRGDKDYMGLIDQLNLLPDAEGEPKTLIDYVNFAVYENGSHKCLYDEEKLVLMLKHLGYSSASVSSFQQGIDSDTAVRRRYSFYVEAVKNSRLSELD